MWSQACPHTQSQHHSVHTFTDHNFISVVPSSSSLPQGYLINYKCKFFIFFHQWSASFTDCAIGGLKYPLLCDQSMYVFVVSKLHLQSWLLEARMMIPTTIVGPSIWSIYRPPSPCFFMTWRHQCHLDISHMVMVMYTGHISG